MTKKVIVNAQYQPVAEGDPASAFSLPADDPRIQIPEADAETAPEPVPYPEEPAERVATKRK